MSKRTDDFKKELEALCKKYNCSIILEEEGDNWGGSSDWSRSIIVAEFNSDWQSGNEIPYEKIEYGSSI